MLHGALFFLKPKKLFRRMLQDLTFCRIVKQDVLVNAKEK